MGVGTPINILEAIERGVDMFDCVMPTRNGRNGMFFTSRGIMNMRNEKWKNDFRRLMNLVRHWWIKSTQKPIYDIFLLQKSCLPCR